MRKDYLPVDAAASSLEEAAFVERFWTEQWQNRDSPPDVSAIARREEYRLMAPHLRGLPSGSRILDGGCGLGEWTVFLAQQGFDVTGLDISEATIARLATWFPTASFRHGDLRRTDFPDASFDAYFSWGTFEHFENGLGDCLTEASRIVRRGGWLFVSVPFQNWRLVLRDARALEHWDEEFDAQSGYRTPQRFYQWRLTREELRRELELHGFSVLGVTPVGKLTGVGRMLQWGFPLFAKGSRPYAMASRVGALVLPASYVSHMILAVAKRR
ncbi:MAG: class I SAM-dependent methyltransferase [Planctomycetota bacterium]|nr:class I SAM-dependent methyltransferase [Planctomycetota bacterium]